MAVKLLIKQLTDDYQLNTFYYDKLSKILFLHLAFPFLALLALTMACFLCSSLISIPEKESHKNTPSGQNMSKDPVLQQTPPPSAIFRTLFTFHLTSIHSSSFVSRSRRRSS